MKLKKLLSTLSVMMLTFSFSMSNSAAVHADDIKMWNLSYTGQQQTFTVPYTGTYKLSVWGGQGGDMLVSPWTGKGGKGGYASGTKFLNAGTVLYIYVGGQGQGYNNGSTNYPGGWNGGGTCYGGASGGGGATDIRTIGGNWNDAAGLNSRVIVAGGGGGSDDHTDGGAGGGLSGLNGVIGASGGIAGLGGTQTSGGTGWINGSFGIGGGAADAYADGGSGGGGYYGGAKGQGYDVSGGGGSSYIGGLLKGITTAGVNSGNGRAKITYVPTYANGIVISKRSDDLKVGGTDKLTALISPDNASVKTVKWTSSDPSIVTVDDNGNIAAVKAGIAIVTATVQDGRNLHGQCRVCVTK